jgi:calcineurin-like phosphoesterase family protein
MSIYFTSDLHHSHKNIVEFTERGKATSKDQHNEWLIDIWNKTVQKNDQVYHLGDLSFATKYSETVGLFS